MSVGEKLMRDLLVLLLCEILVHGTCKVFLSCRYDRSGLQRARWVLRRNDNTVLVSPVGH
jgi:hypothetical protein